MKIFIIGSHQYKQKFFELQLQLKEEGHEVSIPAFDDHVNFDELEVCEYNRKQIEWADTVYLIWDRRSAGTVFDFGMVFALRKPFKIHYLEPKTLEGVMQKYALSFVEKSKEI